MGIDGIGGGRPPIGPAGGGIGPTQTNPTGGEAFSVDRGTASAKAGAADKVATAELDRLQSGEISLDDYLQTRADKAVAHLESVVPAEQLELIKEQLVNQMKQDPSVAALVQRATGVLPTDNEG